MRNSLQTCFYTSCEHNSFSSCQLFAEYNLAWLLVHSKTAWYHNLWRLLFTLHRSTCQKFNLAWVFMQKKLDFTYDLIQGCKNVVAQSFSMTKTLECANFSFTFCTSCIWMLYSKPFCTLDLMKTSASLWKLTCTAKMCSFSLQHHFDDFCKSCNA